MPIIMYLFNEYGEELGGKFTDDKNSFHSLN